MLFTLKEAIQNIGNKTTVQMTKIQQFLFKMSSSTEDSLRNIVAECIGTIGRLNLNPELKKEIISNLSSNNDSTRFVTASAFKFFCIKGSNLTDELREVIDALSKRIADPSLLARTAVLKSLSMITHNIQLSLHDQVDKKFFEELKDSLRINQALIKQVDVGAFKIVTDHGENQRSSAFTLLESILDFKKVNFEEDIVKVVLEGIDNEEKNEDIKIVRMNILRKLCKKTSAKVASHFDLIESKFGKITESLNKQKQDGDRGQDILK